MFDFQKAGVGYRRLVVSKGLHQSQCRRSFQWSNKRCVATSEVVPFHPCFHLFGGQKPTTRTRVQGTIKPDRLPQDLAFNDCAIRNVLIRPCRTLRNIAIKISLCRQMTNASFEAVWQQHRARSGKLLKPPAWQIATDHGEAGRPPCNRTKRSCQNVRVACDNIRSQVVAVRSRTIHDHAWAAPQAVGPADADLQGSTPQHQQLPLNSNSRPASWGDHEAAAAKITVGGGTRFHDHNLSASAGARRRTRTGGQLELPQRFGF